MKLKMFIKKFIGKNTLIRLWHKIDTGHEMVNGDSPQMEWKLSQGEYADSNVMYVKDIYVPKSHYIEAVNIVIERK